MKERDLMKYLRGEASPKERERIAVWVDESEDNRSTLDLMRLTLEASLMGACHDKKAAVSPQKPARRKKNVFRTLAYAAVAAAIATVFVLPSLPGGSGEVSVQRVCAPVGQQMRVDLSDGTVVRLNSNSELTFSDLGEKGCRKVSLRGEAFFEVAKDPKRPFIVSTPDFDVRVLGTVFNVNTYYSKQSVVLVSGAVEILHDNETYSLKPDDLFSYDSSTGNRSISKVNTDEYTSWTNGYLQFDSESLDLVFTQMQSYFGIRFEYDSTKASTVSMLGKLELREGLTAALESLSNSEVIDYEFRDSSTVSIRIL